MSPQAGLDRGRAILFVSPFCPPFIGGASTFLDAMASRMAAAGHDVIILTTDARQASDFWLPPPPLESARGSSPTQSGEPDSFTIERLAIRYPAPAPYLFGFLRRLSHRLSQAGLPAGVQHRLLIGLARWMPPLPDLPATLDRLTPAADLVMAIDSSWDGMFTAAGAAAARHGKPLVVMPLMHLGATDVKTHYQMPHQVALYRSAAAILALSRSEADSYIALGAAPGRVRVVGMGIDSAAWVPDPSEVAAFRERLGVHNSPLVAFLGANTYDKGAFTLADAVVRLNGMLVEQAGELATLVCAGPLSKELEAHVAELAPGAQAALAGHLHVLGVVDEPTKRLVLAACDVLALPSRVDAFGIVILEAWLNDKPVIGADAGGIPELIEDGETGVLVPFGDSGALADAIHRLIGNRELAAQMGRAGHEQVHQRFTWDHTYGTLARVFGEILQEARGR